MAGVSGCFRDISWLLRIAADPRRHELTLIFLLECVGVLTFVYFLYGAAADTATGAGAAACSWLFERSGIRDHGDGV